MIQVAAQIYVYAYVLNAEYFWRKKRTEVMKKQEEILTVTTSRNTYRSGKVAISRRTVVKKEFEVAGELHEPPVIANVTRDVVSSPPTNNSWQCAKQYLQHDCFFRFALQSKLSSYYLVDLQKPSYRVATDAHVVDALADAISLNGLHPYLDHICLVGAERWEDGFINGLLSSKLIFPLLSNACVASLRSSWDNVVLEWELAFGRQDQGLAVVIPLLLDETEAPFIFPALDTFPDIFHDHPKSPRKRTIRQLMAQMFSQLGITVQVQREFDTAKVDLSCIARIMQLYRMSGCSDGPITPDLLSLNKTEFEKLQMHLGTYPVESPKVVENTNSLGMLFGQDVLDWVCDVNSDVLFVDTNDSEELVVSSSLQFQKHNKLGATIDFSRVASPAETILKCACNLASAFPELGRHLLNQPKSLFSVSIDRLFEHTIVGPIKETVSTSTSKVVLLFYGFESDEGFASLQTVWKLFAEGSGLFKFLFIGSHPDLAALLEEYTVSSYDLDFALESVDKNPAQSLAVQLQSRATMAIKVPMEDGPISEIIDPFIGNIGVEEADFIICCGVVDDLHIAVALRNELTSNGNKTVYIQDPTVSTLLNCPAKQPLILYIFSNNLVSQLNNESNLFISHIDQGSVSHCLPILLKRNEIAFSISSLFQHTYKSEIQKKIVTNLFAMQGLTVDEVAVKRAVSSIFQIRKLVLGLKTTESIGSEKRLLSAEEDAALLSWLNPSFSIVNERRSNLLNQYISGTRMWLVSEIDEWIRDEREGGAQLLWIKAKAGVGKSVMSALIADRLHRENALAAAFFCKHDDQRLKTPLLMVTTMAYSLAQWSPAIGRFLLTLMQNETAVDFRASASLLFRQLVLDPLNELAENSSSLQPVVLVVDALDECGDVNARANMLAIFATEFHKLPSFVRVLVTSRPEEDIVDALSNLPQRHISPTDANNQADARIIATKALSRLRVCVGQNIDDIVEKVILKSGGLLVWLTMALRSLQELQEVSLESIDVLPEGLDQMYTTTFQKLFGRRTDVLLSRVIQTLSIAVLPLTLPHIIHLASITEIQARHCIDKLRPVLSEDQSELTFMHKSITDFLTNSPDEKFHVDVELCNKQLALRLLTLMNQSLLHHNMGNLVASKPYVSADSDAFDGHFEYSCKCWFDHFSRAEPSLELCQELIAFAQDHLLHWVEALALLSAFNMVSTISSNFTVYWRNLSHLAKDKAALVENLFKDVYDLSINFREAIIFNPLQVYNSGLLWTPQDSALYNQYHRQGEKPEIVLGSLQSGGPLTFTGHEERVTAVVYSSDGSLLVSADESGSLKVWSVATGECVLTMHEEDSVYSVALCPDDKIIVAGTLAGELAIWDIESGECLKRVDAHSQMVLDLVIFPEGKTVVSASWDKTIAVSSLETGHCMKKLKGHSKKVTSIAVSSDGSTLVSGSYDKTVKVWLLKTGACLKTLKGHSQYVQSVLWHTVQSVLSASSDGTIKCWDLNSGNCIRTFVSENEILSIVMVDSTTLLSGGGDGLKTWSIETGDFLKPLEGNMISLCMSPDRMCVVGVDGTSLQISSINSKTTRQDEDCHTDSILSADISCNGFVVTGSSDQLVKVWSVESGGCVRTFSGHDSAVYAVAISLDGSLIAAGDNSKFVKIWSTSQDEPVMIFQEHLKAVWCVALSTNKKWVASGSKDTTVRIVSILQNSSQQLVLSGHDDFVQVVKFSPDDKYVVSGSRDTFVKVWDVESGECVWTLKGHTFYVSSIVFSDDQKYFYSDATHEVIVWSLESGKRVLNPLFGDSELNVVGNWLVKRNGDERISRIPESALGAWIQSGKHVIFYADNHVFGLKL
ncbi:UNVERIFIED_CONTAM: hypothetical protein HDU68_001732 [Siphonaria sp. JEL0065]|nr:hypothetical protein HDU68_001732 [Siphonaria sp. JEL0065]